MSLCGRQPTKLRRRALPGERNPRLLVTWLTNHPALASQAFRLLALSRITGRRQPGCAPEAGTARPVYVGHLG
jgi:hypothetical protein